MEEIDFSSIASFYQACIGPTMMGIGLAGLAWSRIGTPLFVLALASYLGIAAPLGLPELAEPLASVGSLAFAAVEIYLRRSLKNEKITGLPDSHMIAKVRALPCLCLFFFCTNNDSLFASCGSVRLKLMGAAAVITITLISFCLAVAVGHTVKRLNELMYLDIDLVVLEGSLISISAPAFPWVYFPIVIGIGFWTAKCLKDR